jgi:hypothetical protein
MRLYHRTTAAAEAAILWSGFVDREAYHGGAGRPEGRSGVRVSDVPPDADERAAALLVINLRVPRASLTAYELVEAGTHRAWCIPAAVLNQAASIAIVADG